MAPITGTVARGHGSASRDFEDGRYGDFEWGFKPFPGTLNLRVPDLELPAATHTFDIADQAVDAAPGTLNDSPIWVLVAEREPDVAQIVAPSRLRDTYNNGDNVTIHV